MKKNPIVYVPALAASLAVICLLLLLASGPGYRFGILDLHTAISFVKWSGEIAIAGAVLAIAGAFISLNQRFSRLSLRVSILALVFSLLLVGNGLRLKKKAEKVPPIHDITTDTQDVPMFKDIAPLRADAPNSLDYGGEEVAAQQREAYPDLKPLEVKLQAKEAYDKALETVKSLGWQVVGQDAEFGDIEATDTTPWFGFKDDVVVRIKPRLDGARIDVRSVSRVGVSDLGKNAQRIRAFFRRFNR